MSKFTPNFDDVMEQIPPGEYNARIMDFEQKVSKSGNDYLNWKAEIFGSSDTKCNGKHIYFITMLSGPGAVNLKTLLKITIDYKGGEFDANDLMGKDISVILTENRDDQGNLRAFPNVKSFGKAKNIDSSDIQF